MSILITGARGNIGSRLVETLTNSGHEVWASARDTTSLRLPPGATPLTLDIADADAPGQLPADVETVFLYPTLGGAAGFLKAARESSVRHVVLLSSPGSYEVGEYEGPIGQVHRAMERAIEDSGLKHTVLYPGWLASNAQRDWGEAIRGEGRVGLTPPNAHVAPIHLDDVAEVAAALLTAEQHRSRLQILTGPRSMTQEEAVGIIAKETGRELGVDDVSKEVALERRPAWMPKEVLESLLDTATAMVGVPATLNNNVERVLGRPPRPFEDWVATHRAEFLPV
ncbi:NAD(P)H-binding protein [Spiractinospora alimapuensis]|uniref:NAD(P)H-binding protein n=1 Tax=Spiractinospora alimapuensis TaxID=2820884 RepID=UPI001F356997|nr:NAD(P)H-binding protein [Spiractinospora alimapuensis]QVQ50201.1 NAD(P)H-binding protein [Spiractinospora alimapuensis]